MLDIKRWWGLELHVEISLVHVISSPVTHLPVPDVPVARYMEMQGMFQGPVDEILQSLPHLAGLLCFY